MGRKPSISSVLTLYLQDVKKVRRNGMKLKLSEHEVNQLMEEYILSLLMDGKTKQINNESGFRMLLFIKSVFSFLKTIIVIIFGCLVSVLTIYIVLQHKPTQYFVQSKLQDFIYPCMKILRFFFLPIITMYPSLTNLYDESCLVVNPLFRVPDMLCPCEDVRAILNVTGEDPRQEQYHSGIPFMVKVDREEISWRKLKSLYKNYSTVFDRDASHLLISTSSHKNKKSSPAVVFNTDFSVNDSLWDHTHIKWRCNRMEPTRLLRSIFGRPDSEPYYAAGVTIEKLVMVDGPRAPLYHLPTTDGTSVFIQQSSGSRLIVLSPADECKEKCTSVSVELPPGHILWFSWWYWRASSLPSPAMETLSISYIGSYL